MQKSVSNKVKITYQRHVAAQISESFADLGNGSRSFLVVHGNSDDLTAGIGEQFHLSHGCWNIGGIGVGHRLNNNMIAPTDHHSANAHCVGIVSCSQFKISD